MKRKLMYLTTLVMICSIFFIPCNAKAEIKATGLKDVIDEEIKLFEGNADYAEQVEKLKNANLSNYSESKDKVNVYLFRGNTCSHCFDAVVFFASIANEYQDKFNLISYEIWSNQDNSKVMDEVAKKLGDEVGGVPYIVVGKKSWNGYTDAYGEEIKEAIDKERSKDVENRYDVMQQIGSKKSSVSSNDIVSLIIIIIVTAGIVTGVIFTRKHA